MLHSERRAAWRCSVTNRSTLRQSTLPLAALLAAGILAPPASAAPESGALRMAQGRPLPRCVLYSSRQVTSDGLMSCSYQCGDRIILRSGYRTCPTSATRPGN